jgi:hypothetical protein
MKLRQNNTWIDVNAYIRQNNQWVFVNNISDANEFLLIISQTTTNLNLQTTFNNIFGATAWTSTKRKRVIVNSGVIVGATSTANYALNIPSGLGGSLKIENNGSIQGAGGAANGGTGGNAIFAGSSGISINNQGTIYAGGGGGGQGGTGGQGSYTTTTQTIVGDLSAFGSVGSGQCNSLCSFYYPGTYGVYNGLCYCAVNSTSTVITAGGTGGAGGVGRGYNQSLTGGSSGSAGGTNAGSGGTGGAGGDWGNNGSAGTAGSNGNYTAGTAGSSGGLSGFYIVNNSNVTWISTGTRAGRVG